MSLLANKNIFQKKVNTFKLLKPINEINNGSLD